MAERETLLSRGVFNVVEGIVKQQEAIKKMAKGPEKKEKQQKMKKVDLPKWLKEFFTPEKIAAEKAQAKDWADKASQAKTHTSISAEADAWAKENRYEATSTQHTIEESKRVYTGALEAVKKSGGTVPDWLPKTDAAIQHSGPAAEFYTRIALLPKELQEDPNILYREATRLYMSMEGMSPEARVETEAVIEKTIAKIEELRKNTPDFAANEHVLRNTLTEDGRAGRVDEAYKLFGEVDFSKLSKQDADWVRKQMQFVFKNGAKPVNQTLTGSWMTELKKRMEKMGDPEARAEAARIIESLSGTYEQFIEEDRIPSTIMLTKKEIALLLRDPIYFFEKYIKDTIRIVESSDFEAHAIEQRLNRFRLLADYFSSDFYDEEKSKALFENDAIREQLDKVRKSLLENKVEVLEHFADRMQALEFSYYLANVSDFEKDTRFQSLILRIGDKGAFASRAQWGGLSETAVNKIREIHDRLSRDPRYAGVRNTSPEMWKEIMERAEKEMWTERHAWQPQYEFYVDQLVEHTKVLKGDGAAGWLIQPTTEARTMDESTMKAIVRVGTASYAMMMEKTERMIQGGTPAERGQWTGWNQFITTNKEEAIAAFFRPRDWFFRKWNNLELGGKAAWIERCLFYVQKDPELQKWAWKKTAMLWRDMQEWASIEDQNIKRNHPVFKQLQTIFSEYEHFIDEHHKIRMHTGNPDAEMEFFTRLAGGGVGARLQTLPKAMENLRGAGLNMRDFTLNKNIMTLHRMVAADIGGEWAQYHGIKPYLFWQSGVRRAAVAGVIAKHDRFGQWYTDAKDEEGVYTGRFLFMARDVIDATSTHFHPQEAMREPRHTAHKVELVIGRAAKYHPLEFIKIRLRELQRENVSAWQNADLFQFNTGVLKGTMMEAQATTLTDSSRLFTIIQQRLMQHGLKPIDYSQGVAGLDAKQLKIVDDVFATSIEGYTLSDGREVAGISLDKEHYFSTMSGYYQEISAKAHEFTHVRYMNAFSTLLWTDDIPLGHLEKPTMLNAMMAESEGQETRAAVLEAAFRNTPLSKYFSEGGRGRTGLWVRAWYDLFVASGLLQPYSDSINTADEKAFTENVILLRKKIPIYQTHVDGIIAATEASAGFYKTAQSKDGYGNWFKWMKNSSIQKEFWDDEAMSLDKGETHHKVVTLQKAIGKIKNYSPAYAEGLENFLGMSHWRRDLKFATLGVGAAWERLHPASYDKVVEFLDENFPLYLYMDKIKNTAAFFAIITAIYAADQAKKGGQESTGGH